MLHMIKIEGPKSQDKGSIEGGVEATSPSPPEKQKGLDASEVTVGNPFEGRQAANKEQREGWDRAVQRAREYLERQHSGQVANEEPTTNKYQDWAAWAEERARRIARASMREAIGPRSDASRKHFIEMINELHSKEDKHA